jgi:outer membrane biogenesis lipoprotein LolB
MLNSIKFPLMILAFAAVIAFLTGCAGQQARNQSQSQSERSQYIQQYNRLMKECAVCQSATGDDCYTLGMKCPE